MHRQSGMCVTCYMRKHGRPQSYVARTCQVCGASFTRHKAQIERGQGIYCSRACARSGSPTRKKARPVVACHTCGTEFEKFNSEIRKTTGDLHFCSPECWYIHNQGENHYQWGGGQNERVNPDYLKWRKAVLHRDKGYCRLCHSRERLEVHHIKRFTTHPAARWEVANGLTLCHDCHVTFRHREEEHEEILGFVASVPVEVIYV